MADAGEYYRRKKEEAEEAAQRLAKHQLDECSGSMGCRTCAQLEAALERARYVGD